jgi:hypothetical protein
MADRAHNARAAMAGRVCRQAREKMMMAARFDISQLFAAVRRGVLLLFDEAAALFGKRSDVKDSHDCYANIEKPKDKSKDDG